MRTRDFERGLKVEAMLKNGFHVVPHGLDERMIEKHIKLLDSIVWVKVWYIGGTQAYIDFMEKGKDDFAYNATDTYHSVKLGREQKNKNWKIIVKASEILTDDILLDLYRKKIKFL